MKQHILIVEDEAGLAELLRDYLLMADYDVDILYEGGSAVEWVREHNPALVLLDLMLPGKDGMAICREVRQFSQVPIIMTTARVEEIDRLLGLELGADDYVCKPYSPREVVARVRSVLRRAGVQMTGSVAQLTGIMLDEGAFKATVNGTNLDLTPVEFRLLNTFMAQPGRVFARGHLLDNLYDDQRVVSDRTIDTHIKNLRKKLEAQLPDQDVIQSVYGVGYKLEIPD
ncbi:two-component system, OmpR family, response regulator BaeR [Amphritea atlantica]|uniref:Two-component system, OmpR family, response regulator BaeR n=1 Tax=Amphritea atlantica TaxID=355243 RepID=A0A1H9HBP2_9GAMM|nr:response regulator [Amphritea atlantica]SEQ59687.1 two-component system, OmpR family, response regulator BaeR [Amphritea atlantica]